MIRGSYHTRDSKKIENETLKPNSQIKVKSGAFMQVKVCFKAVRIFERTRDVSHAMTNTEQQVKAY